MRMWDVRPTVMCRKHLLGEHVEMHMAVGSIRRNKSISGYTDNGLLDTSKIKERHDALVIEMRARGYKHYSIMLYDDVLNDGSVDADDNLIALCARCAECSERAQNDN